VWPFILRRLSLDTGSGPSNLHNCFCGSSCISEKSIVDEIRNCVRSGLASPVCALLSCDQESKRAPAGATKSRFPRYNRLRGHSGRAPLPRPPRGLVPWTAVRSSRAKASRCEQSTHPPISSAGDICLWVRDVIYLSRGPDQHPLGGERAVAAFPRALSCGRRSTA
jgi:hypothetical protein